MKKIFSFILVITFMLLNTSVIFASDDGNMSNFKNVKVYTENQFKDVLSTDWFAENIKKAYELGLVSGNSETSYNPTGNVSIAETIALACRLNNIYTENNAKFEGGDEWYQPYVEYALDNKIIESEYGNYNVSATRREFATILSNSLPKDALTAINDISDIPDVDGNESNIYMLYNAGILAGNDKYGTFNPTSNIQRSEVAAIIVRMADKTRRIEFTLEQMPVEVDSISLDNTSLSMTVGDTAKLNATILPNNATDKNIVWKSYNTRVATVDDGEIKALSQGEAIITAVSANGKSADCKISVTAAPIEYSGHGDKVINNVNIPFGSYYAELSHNGDRNFISKLYYGERSYDYFLLANEIGICTKQVALYNNGNAAVNGGTLEVKADGDWTIKIKPVTGTTTTHIKGSGEVVTGIFTAKASRATVNLSHKGKSNFIAKIIRYNGRNSYDYESLSNEIGNYNGQTVVDLALGERYYFYVRADGNWEIDLGWGDSVTNYTLSEVSSSDNYDSDEYEEVDDDDYDYDDDDKFSYSDAASLNKYADAATKACNNAARKALDAYKNQYMKTIYVAEAINYARTAKTNIEYAITILESKVELTYEDGGTVLDEAYEAKSAINKILKFDIEDGNVNDLATLCINAGTKTIKVQKASVELIKAFAD